MAEQEQSRRRLNCHEQMLDAQSQCVPCKLCGGNAIISDAGEGAGYYIACSNSQSFREAKGCLITLRRQGGWAYNVMDWWNRLHATPDAVNADKAVRPSTDNGFLSFWYKNYRGEVSERTVIPMRVYHGATDWHPTPQWLLEAWDMEKDAVRAFAMEDMQAAPDKAVAQEGAGEGDTPVRALTLLANTFDRWLIDGPNAQPHYSDGMRPWGTGDLRWLSYSLKQAIATPAPDKALIPEAAVGEIKPYRARKSDYMIDERDDDMLIAQRHWQYGWICIARRPKLMTNAEWRPDAERIVAALSTPTPVEEPEKGATGFINAIHDASPNGVGVNVKHHPNGDWSVGEANAGQVEEALRYYANDEHYDSGDVPGHIYVLDDHGRYARAALAATNAGQVEALREAVKEGLICVDADISTREFELAEDECDAPEDDYVLKVFKERHAKMTAALKANGDAS